jgi:hypothetical protein
MELYLHCPVHLRGLVFKHRGSYSNAFSNVLGCMLGDLGLVRRRGKDFYFYIMFELGIVLSSPYCIPFTFASHGFVLTCKSSLPYLNKYDCYS